MEKNLISVIMGSQSDWKTMRFACDVLEEFKIMAEQNLVSIKLLDKKITGFNYSNGKFINISIIHII